MDAIFDDFRKAQLEIKKRWYNRCIELLTKNIYPDSQGLPVVLTFNKPVSPDFNRSKSIIAFEALITRNKRFNGDIEQEILFQVKAGAPQYYYIGGLPFNEIESIELHPDYYGDYPPVAPNRKAEEFNDYMLKLLPKNSFTNVIFVFSHPIVMYPWSIIPIDTYKIPVIVQELKGRNDPDYIFKVCFYIRTNKNLFYYTSFIPIEHLKEIHLESNYNAPLKIKTQGNQVTDKLKLNKKINYDYSGIDKNWEEIDITPLLKDISIERTDDNCLLCGRHTSSPSKFVFLLKNGNIVNKTSYPLKDNIIGFKPVGSECVKKIGADFIFNKDMISKDEKVLELQTNDDRKLIEGIEFP